MQTHLSAFVWLCADVYACRSVCMCMCVYTNTHTHVCVHTHAHTRTGSDTIDMVVFTRKKVNKSDLSIISWAYVSAAHPQKITQNPKKWKTTFFFPKMLAQGVKIYLLWKLTQYLIFLGLHLCFSKCWEQYKKVKERKCFVFFKLVALNLWNRKLLQLKKRLMALAVGFVDLTGALYRGT